MCDPRIQIDIGSIEAFEPQDSLQASYEFNAGIRLLSTHVIGSASCGILELIDTEIFAPPMMFRIAMQAENMQLQISGGVGVLVQPLDHLGSQ